MANVFELLDFGNARRTPMIRQSEASECGLACLAMVAGHYGLQADMPTFRRQFGISSRGATLRTIMSLADQLGFSARALRAEINELGKIQAPAILHWNMNHFVVLNRVSLTWRGRRFHINDPARGCLHLSESEFSKSFTGIAIELIKSNKFRPQKVKSSLKISQLWSSINGARGALAGILSLTIILQLISLITPFFLQIGIDTALPANDNQLLSALAFGFGGLAFVSMVTNLLRSVAILNINNALSFQIINNLYRHLVSLPLSWFEKRHTGDVISRFSSTQPIVEFIGQGITSSAIDAMMVIITITMMFIYSTTLSCLALLACVAYVSIKLGSFAAMRGANASAITASARESSAFIETMRGISTVKAFGQEQGRQRTWQTLKASAINASLKLGRITARFDAISGFALAIERIIFVYLAVSLAMKGAFTVGMIFAFQAYKQQFLDAMTRLVDQGIRYWLLDVHLTRIADIALSRPEPVGTRKLRNLPIRGDIELRGVSFRYGAGDPEVLSYVDLHVKAGEMVAFVGPSGGGKTTLLKIMMGLLEPTTGTVLIDGQPLDQLGLHAWRSRIGSVLQDDRLFAGSLAENIAFFESEVDMDRVREACRRAAIIDEVDAMPLGLETLVGDMGSSLSGGQRQRVMLARALYAQPAVLFMDEGTANLDPANETKVVEALRDIHATRLVSAHRPLAIHAASRIFMVREGRLVKVGTSQIDKIQSTPNVVEQGNNILT